MDFKHLKTLALTFAFIGALSVSAYATSIGAATVTADALKLRTEPNVSSRVMKLSPQGSLVVVGTKINDGWYRVVYQGATGYMSSDFLNFSEKLEGDFGTGTTYGTDVPLRDSVSQESNVVSVFDDGTEMQILGVFGGWYKVKYGGQTGFVFSDFFSLNGGVIESPGQKIVDTAKQYLGTPYVWGGSSPRGFDCSGLVNYVYDQCGYSINRTAASIYENGAYVETTELQVGDAVCFSSYSNYIGHVGIYIGDGQFIHASSGSGLVIISDLSESYYKSHYFGARRIV